MLKYTEFKGYWWNENWYYYEILISYAFEIFIAKQL
jgi:hypothetical protein